jgi:tetratricopeptide (TPR) repeat protein
MVGLTVLFCLYAQTASKPEALMKNLGGFHRATSTTNPVAQKYFDQGLACLYGYQVRSARRSFEKAAELDKDLALAYWGIAYAYGPNINFPAVDDDLSKAALAALDKADLARNATPLERKLIAAQRLRFSVPAPKDRTTLNSNYTQAMRKIWQAHPNDPDIGAMLADALLNERPWKQWSLDGVAQPGTLEAIKTLEQCLKLNPKHPMTLHMYIHAVEGSPNPKMALKVAETLDGLQPDLSHMQHMPCHIYARLGMWDRAIAANIRARKRDNEYMKSRGFVNPLWPNADHLGAALAYAAGMKGQSQLALSAVDTKGFSRKWMAENGTDLDGDLAMPYMVMQQFGKWEQILAAEPFPDNLPVSQTILLGAQTVAYSALGRLSEAKDAFGRFLTAKARVPADRSNGISLYSSILDVEKHLCLGEILVRQEGTFAEGLKELELAVSLEDRLEYSEPPSWLMPTRHALGAALLMAGKHSAAETVFRVQLQKTPNNGWALMGLSKSLRGQGKVAESKKYEAMFKHEWRNADITISTSCMCLEPSARSKS